MAQDGPQRQLHRHRRKPQARRLGPGPHQLLAHHHPQHPHLRPRRQLFERQPGRLYQPQPHRHGADGRHPAGPPETHGQRLPRHPADEETHLALGVRLGPRLVEGRALQADSQPRHLDARLEHQFGAEERQQVLGAQELRDLCRQDRRAFVHRHGRTGSMVEQLGLREHPEHQPA